MNPENKEQGNEILTSVILQLAIYPVRRVEEMAAHLLQSLLSDEIHGAQLFSYCFSQRCVAIPVFGKERE